MSILPHIFFLWLSIFPYLYSCKYIYRGVATNEWSGGCQDLQALNRMSWYYNWDSKPLSNIASCQLPNNRVIEYVPMIWGGGSVTNNIISKLPTNFTYLMSFNEPNFPSQSNLAPAQAATLWMNVQQQLITAGIFDKIQIGAPSAAPGGSMDPVKWLTEFFGNCTGCRFDFQNWHIYDCNAPYYDAGAVKYWINQAATFGRPIWLTEFDCPSAPTVELELQWMNAVLPYLDSDSRIARYAWFTARPTNVGITTSLFNGATSELTTVANNYMNRGDCMMINNIGQMSVDVNCTMTSSSSSPSSSSSSSTGSNGIPSRNNHGIISTPHIILISLMSFLSLMISC